MWAIWKGRNEKVFKSQDPNSTATIILASPQTMEFIKANQASIRHNPQLNGVPSPQLRRWKPPDTGYIKINTYAAFKSETRKGSYATICRDYNGNLFTMNVARLFASSPLVAEASALREGVKLAVNLQISHVSLESNNLLLIKACNNECQAHEIQKILEDIDKMYNTFQRCKFTWVSRSANSAAHELADMSFKGQLQANWNQSVLESLCRILRSEARRSDLNPFATPFNSRQ